MKPNYSRPGMYFIQTNNRREESILIINPNGKAERMYLNTEEISDDPFIISYLSKRDPKLTVEAFKAVCLVVDFLGNL